VDKREGIGGFVFVQGSWIFEAGLVLNSSRLCRAWSSLRPAAVVAADVVAAAAALFVVAAAVP